MSAVERTEADREPEAAACPGCAFNTHVATHQHGELLADGQAQSGTAVFPGGRHIGLAE